MGLARLLTYGLGISAFLLSVAVFHIGGSTGVQFFCLIGIAVFFALNGAAPSRFLVWFGGLCLIVVLTLFLQIQTGADSANSLKGLVSFSLSLFSIWVGATLVTGAGGTYWPLYLQGYLIGALLSSALAILQYTAWGILNIQTTLLFGLHNNRSFSDITLLSNDMFATVRAFAMTAEPALLALLLLPASIVFWLRARYLPFFFVALGLYATQSLTAAACLTAFILWRFMFGQKLSGWGTKIVGISVGLFAAAFIVAALMGSFASGGDDAANLGLKARILNAATDPSTLSRTNSLLSGTFAIAERPWTGWGMQSEGLLQFVLARATLLEANAGINSLALSLAAWFGIPAALYILFVPFRFWLMSRADSETRLFVLASVLPPLLTLNYYTVYSVWLCIGVAGGWVFASAQVKDRINNAD